MLFIYVHKYFTKQFVGATTRVLGWRGSDGTDVNSSSITEAPVQKKKKPKNNSKKIRFFVSCWFLVLFFFYSIRILIKTVSLVRLVHHGLRQICYL